MIIYEGAASPSFARELSRATTGALGPHTRARKSQVLTGLEFDTRWLDRDIDAFGADAVLTLTPLGSRTGTRGETVSLIYGATLEDRASRQPLWAARMVCSVWWIESAAGKLVEALAGDHLIAATPSTGSPFED